MALGPATRNRDDGPRLPPLSLGLTSVRFIVNKLETQYARVTSPQTDQGLVKYDPNVDEGYEDYHDSLLVQSRGKVWNRFASNLGLTIGRFIPSVTIANFGIFALTTGFFAPRMITYFVVYPFCRLVFGTLYPAYASYKAVRTKNLKEYVKWMMYWIVFALFTCTETFTDVFLSWFPFYYEVKIVIVLWLLSPATKGSSILYRKFVHPALCRREQEIDEYIAKAKDQGYHTVLNLGTKGVNYATTVIMQTAIKGGGGLVQQLRKSYSLSDLTECEPRDERGNDEADDVLTEPRIIRRGGKSGYSTRRSASESNSRSPMYFPEVDVDVRNRNRSDEPDLSHIKSSEDISSGYSSADNSASLTRTSSVGARVRGRPGRTTVTTIKRPQAAEDEVIIEEIQDDDSFEYANMPPLVNLPSPIFLSHTQPPFLYQYVGDQVKILQVLGNYPLNSNANTETHCTDARDQNNATPHEIPVNSSVNVNDSVVDDSELEDNIDKVDNIRAINIENQEIDNNNDSTITSEDNLTKTASNPTDVAKEQSDVTNIEISLNDNESAESDDEASFGTPDNSPRSKRKSPKGKYGKGKAPAPPQSEIEVTAMDNSLSKDIQRHIESDTSLENLVDIMNKVPNACFKETNLPKNLHVVNPISENKRRHKSKSPARVQKGNSSGIGKLLQLPGKLAFWHKNGEKSKSEECDLSRSRRKSSFNESVVDDFQSCVELDATISDDFKQTESTEVCPTETGDDQITFKDADDLENEVISQDIIDKSYALQKLIDAKIESHPEYKYISLHEGTPTSSKSTDV